MAPLHYRMMDGCYWVPVQPAHTWVCWQMEHSSRWGGAGLSWTPDLSSQRSQGDSTWRQHSDKRSRNNSETNSVLTLVVHFMYMPTTCDLSCPWSLTDEASYALGEDRQWETAMIRGWKREKKMDHITHSSKLSWDCSWEKKCFSSSFYRWVGPEWMPVLSDAHLSNRVQ